MRNELRKRRLDEDLENFRDYVVGDSDPVSWAKKFSLDVLVRAYRILRPNSAVGLFGESSVSMISEAIARLRCENTHVCSSLVEDSNGLPSDSITVEAIASKKKIGY